MENISIKNCYLATLAPLKYYDNKYKPIMSKSFKTIIVYSNARHHSLKPVDVISNKEYDE